MAEEYKARYKGIRGTAKVIGKSALRAIKGMVDEEGQGEAGKAARRLAGRSKQLNEAMEEAKRGRQREAQTTDSNN